MSESTGTTQPIKPVKKTPRWRSILFSILGVLALLALGGLGGYNSGLADRKSAESQVISQQLTEQMQYALVDEQFGRFEAAKQRLEFIIQHDPSYPGVQEELAKVLVQMSIPTPTPTPTLTPTPDLRGAQAMFATAQQLIAAGDWPNALAALDQLRKKEPTYNTSQVDGMYFFALRNYGVDLIQKQGNLETGIYELTLAERFCMNCLDRDANALREGARAYILAASFWEVDWKQAAYYFSQVGFSYLSDGTMTASQRYHFALMRYGDKLFAANKFCDAWEQYKAAQSIGNLDATAARNANISYQTCYPPTEVPTATEVIPPTDIPPTDTPTP